MTNRYRNSRERYDEARGFYYLRARDFYQSSTLQNCATLIENSSHGSDLFPLPCSLFLVPCSLFLVPCSLFLVPTSYFLLPTSYFLLPTSYFLLPTSYFLLPTSYFLLPTSYFLLPTSYFLLPTSYFPTRACTYSPDLTFTKFSGPSLAPFKR